MLFLKSWLEEYIDLGNIPNEELAKNLTNKSGEVEDIITLDDYFNSLVLLGKIKNLRKHPDADKLQVFEVDLGNFKPEFLSDDRNYIQIVSAAPNVKEGLIVPVALPGARLNGFTVTSKIMRGIKSEGLCLGKSELDLETEFSKGLWDVQEDLYNAGEFLGKSVCEVFPELFPSEILFDITYLADKIASCNNYLGLAREISIVFENPELLTQRARELLDPSFLLEQIIQRVDNKSDLSQKFEYFDELNYTKLFYLYHLKLKKEYSLPHLIRKRMFLTKQNLTGTPADISNYIMQDIGQPSHMFSYAKIQEKLGKDDQSWIIQENTEKTKFQGLGQLKDITLNEGVIKLVNQKNHIVHLPGISGSMETKIQTDDQDIIIEIANFCAEGVASSSFELGIRSDGARIWAGEVNPALHLTTLVRYIELMPGNWYNLLSWLHPNLLDKTDCNSDSSFLKKLDKLIELIKKKKIKPDLDYISSRIDKKENDRKLQITKKLNLTGTFSNDYYYHNIFYGQVKTQEDILNLVCSLIGYDNLDSEYLSMTTESKKDPKYNQIKTLAKLATDFGFVEIMPRPMLNPSKILDLQSSIELASYSSKEFSVMRTSPLDTGLPALSYNISKGYKNIKLFELAKIYRKIDAKVQEKTILWLGLVNEDPYILTTFIHKLSLLIQSPVLETTKETDGYIYTMSGKIQARITQISKKLMKKFQIPITKTVFSLEIDLTNWPKNYYKYNQYHNLSPFPPLKRTYSLELKPELQFKKIKDEIISAFPEDLEVRIDPIERFRSKESDVLNLDVEYISYEQNIQAVEINTYEEKLWKSLKDIGLIKLR